jgi:hypothetical protein
MKRRARLWAIDRDLSRAARLLDSVAGRIRDANFRPGRNILRIAEALVRISDIQFEIYAAQPGLLPRKLVASKFGAKVLSNRSLERAGMKPRRPSKRASAGRSTPLRSATA